MQHSEAETQGQAGDPPAWRCVNMSCARALPRRVIYCPYCGINQSTAMPRTVTPTPTPSPMPSTAPPPERVTEAAAPYRAPPVVEQPKPSAPAPQPVQASVGVAAAQPAAAAPPKRKPLGIAWWIIGLCVLWLVWISQRPASVKLDARVDRAVALAAACKSNEAQAELIALRATAASTAQLARVQQALDDADVSCRRAIRAKSPRSSRPAGQSQSTRNLVADARAAMARGDYRAAADKMEVCVAMVDANTRECSELKVRAERLDGERQRCLARGADWLGDQCQ